LKIGSPFSKKIKTNNVIDSVVSTVKEKMKRILTSSCKDYELIFLNCNCK